MKKLKVHEDTLGPGGAALQAVDQLERLVRWCRDPIVAETQEGNEGFWEAVNDASLAVDQARNRGWRHK